MNEGADLTAVSKLKGDSRASTTANRYYESRSDEIVRAASLLQDIESVAATPKEVGEYFITKRRLRIFSLFNNW